MNAAANSKISLLLSEATGRLIDDVAADPEDREQICRRFVDEIRNTVQVAIEVAFKEVAAEYGLSPAEH